MKALARTYLETRGYRIIDETPEESMHCIDPGIYDRLWTAVERAINAEIRQGPGPTRWYMEGDRNSRAIYFADDPVVYPKVVHLANRMAILGWKLATSNDLAGVDETPRKFFRVNPDDLETIDRWFNSVESTPARYLGPVPPEAFVRLLWFVPSQGCWVKSVHAKPLPLP